MKMLIETAREPANSTETSFALLFHVLSTFIAAYQTRTHSTTTESTP